jgi:hypothetical protein
MTEGRSDAICVPQEGQTLGIELLSIFSEIHIFFTIEIIFVVVIALLPR